MADKFEAMTAFVAVCDEAGFARAARRLGVSPSAVTRLIAALEERLGTRLLQRTTRSVKPTEAGTRFLEQSRRILSDLAEAEFAAQDGKTRPRGCLTVSAPLLFGRLHIAPLLSDYLAANEGVTADLQVNDRFVNLVEEGVDVAIRIGHLPDSALIAKRIGQTRRILVASPGYLARKGSVDHPSDLTRLDLVVFTNLAPVREWTFRQAGDAAITVPVHARLSTNSGDAAISHAIAGGGVTAVFSYQALEAIGNGQLAEVLPAYAPPAFPIQVVYPASRLLSAKVRAFVDALDAGTSRWQRDTEMAT